MVAMTSLQIISGSKLCQISIDFGETSGGSRCRTLQMACRRGKQQGQPAWAALSARSERRNELESEPAADCWGKVVVVQEANPGAMGNGDVESAADEGIGDADERVEALGKVMVDIK